MVPEPERPADRAARLALDLAAAKRRIADLERRVAELESGKR